MAMAYLQQMMNGQQQTPAMAQRPMMPGARNPVPIANAANMAPNAQRAQSMDPQFLQMVQLLTRLRALPQQALPQQQAMPAMGQSPLQGALSSQTQSPPYGQGAY